MSWAHGNQRNTGNKKSYSFPMFHRTHRRLAGELLLGISERVLFLIMNKDTIGGEALDVAKTRISFS